jgi:CHAT domain-containing protein
MRKCVIIGGLLLALVASALLLTLGVSARRADRSGKSVAQRNGDLAWRAMNLRQEGERHRAAGSYDQARDAYEQALEIHRGLYPTESFPHGHTELAISLNNLAIAYEDTGEYAKAEPLYTEVVAMFRALYPREQFPQGHADLAKTIGNVAVFYYKTGEYARAEALYQEALAMKRSLYFKELPLQVEGQAHVGIGRGDYADLVATTNNLATLYLGVGDYDRAEPLLREALEVYWQLYPREQFPRGHAQLAVSIDNLATLHNMRGEYRKALPLCQEALAMYRSLFPRGEFPRGHLDLAVSIHNLAQLHKHAGEPDQAAPLFAEALAMFRALLPRDRYPLGHPLLVHTLGSLGDLHLARGEFRQAMPLFQEALALQRAQALRYADILAEAEALNYVASQPEVRDGLLSASRHLPTASVYDDLWDGRAALTRLQERRHRDLMASRDRDTADLAAQLRRARSALARRLLNPLSDPDEQREVVQQLTDAKEDLEKRIAARLRLAPQPAAPSNTPRQLALALPARSAFIDVYRYTDSGHDAPRQGAQGHNSTLRYCAFIVLPGQSATRVELTAAAPIERAWADWRRAIVKNGTDLGAERDAASRFADLAWRPILAVLPPDVTTLYLVPDGELHQVPWGAVPGRTPETVLLDDCAVCLVPHGPFLLERLQARPDPDVGDTLLAYGGIDYDHEPATVVRHDDVRRPLLRDGRLHWAGLPGTAKEQGQIVALARKVLKSEPIGRSGTDATTRQLEDDLPRARFAHLATHGFFADPEFRSAIQVERQFEHTTRDRRSGARSPLVLSGLVLAGANRPAEEAADDRGIITAEGLIALRMEGLQLAVLSACETGLGAYGGGEGVYGLQRAFHVAGCRNVIASLWQVSDRATQALMVLFYRNLWENKLDPVEALRQAQRTLYRHPDAVEVAQKRGVDFSVSDLPPVEKKPKRTPTAHWAAFTFSGVRPPGRQAPPARP